MTVTRYDSGEFSSPTRTPNGYLRCDAKITRVGVFPYRLADNSRRLELRLPSEVFTEDSLRSFETVPLTNSHPREKLTPKNTRRFQTGTVGNVRKHDAHVAANVLVTDESAIADVEAGKSQLSCGYQCDLEFTPGVTSGIEGVPDGIRYDAIQRNIVGNHVAIVTKGRAGTDTALHLDADDAEMVTTDLRDPSPTPGPTPGPDGGKQMKVIKIDGIDCEMTEQAAQVVSKEIAKHDQAMEAKAAKDKQHADALATEKARADKADEDLKERKDATSEESIRGLVQTRVALETSAAKVLKDDEAQVEKLDGMSEKEIKTAVVLKVSPGAQEKLDAGDDAYLDARYDAAMESFKEDDDHKKPPPKKVVKVKRHDSVAHTDSASARESMRERHINAGREPIVATPANS